MSELDIIYGKQAVCELLRAGRRKVHSLLISSGSQLTGPTREIIALARRARIEPRSCEKRELDRLTLSGNHQGVVAEASAYPYVDLEDLIGTASAPVSEPASSPAVPAGPPFLLVLDHLQDPQNLGSLMRSAEVGGVTGVVLPRDRAAPITPAVVRTSSGAVEHLRVAVVSNLSQAVDRLRDRGLRVVGLEAGPDSRSWAVADLAGPVALVVGSEGEGLTKIIRKRCDFLMSLPVCGRVGSLNAAVAGAIALFEVRRQRDAAAAPPEVR